MKFIKWKTFPMRWMESFQISCSICCYTRVFSLSWLHLPFAIFFLLTILRELKNESKIHVLNRIFIVSMSMFGGSKKKKFYLSMQFFYLLLEHKLSSEIQLLSVCMEMIKNLDAFNFKLLQLVGAIWICKKKKKYWGVECKNFIFFLINFFYRFWFSMVDDSKKK